VNERLLRASRSPLAAALLRWILGLIFLYAGFAKVLDPTGFAQAVDNYRLLPGWLVYPAAVFLPWVEVVVGLSLLSGVLLRGGALLASGLLGVFAVALFVSLIRGLDIACGCFSPANGSEKINWLYLARDLLLLGVAAHVLLFDAGRFALRAPRMPFIDHKV
jgi:putative oxidoreductase